MKKFLGTKIDTNRIFGLDFLRALAIIYVMYRHAGNFVPKTLGKYYSFFILDGVGIFFVLSGFLIGSILIKQLYQYEFNFKALKYFWFKRWSRTLPNYYLFLIFAIILDYALNITQPQIWMLKYFVFCQNLFSGTPNFFTHSWSLSVEEWFYLITPILLMIGLKFTKLPLKSIFLILIILIITFVTGIRIYKSLYIENYKDFQNIAGSVFYRLDSLMFGMLAAYFSFFYPKFWTKYKLPSLIFGIALFLIHFALKNNSYNYEIFSFTLISCMVLFTLPYMSQWKSTKSFIFKPVTFISLISYSLYLINSIVVRKLEYLIDWNAISLYLHNHYNYELKWSIALGVNYMLSWLFSILIASLVYNKFEIPSTDYFRKKIHIKLDQKKINP